GACHARDRRPRPVQQPEATRTISPPVGRAVKPETAAMARASAVAGMARSYTVGCRERGVAGSVTCRCPHRRTRAGGWPATLAAFSARLIELSEVGPCDC